MLTIICITALAYFIMGKDFSSLLEKAKNIDWRSEANELFQKIRPYAIKAGRAAATPLLQFWYVLQDSFRNHDTQLMVNPDSQVIQFFLLNHQHHLVFNVLCLHDKMRQFISLFIKYHILKPQH